MSMSPASMASSAACQPLPGRIRCLEPLVRIFFTGFQNEFSQVPGQVLYQFSSSRQEACFSANVPWNCPWHRVPATAQQNRPPQMPLLIACPGCHLRLGEAKWTLNTNQAKKNKVEKHFDQPFHSDLQLLHFFEILSLARDGNSSREWLNRHLIDPTPVLTTRWQV